MFKLLYFTWDPSTGIDLGPLTLHYYSLMFILAFALGYLIMTKIFKIDGVNQKYLEPVFTWTLIGTIFGLMIIPGLYYIFANIAAKSKLTYYEEENPLTEKTEPYQHDGKFEDK